jgi:hypothetical protein
MFDLEFGGDVLLELDVIDVQHKLGHHSGRRGEHLTNQLIKSFLCAPNYRIERNRIIKPYSVPDPDP